MARRPLIGIVMDWHTNGSFAVQPHYALRTAFFSALETHGASVVGIPFHADDIATYLDLCDGLLFPGGDYSFPPEWYHGEGGSLNEPSPRGPFEIELMTRALETQKPVLGICCGMQVMAASFGATFYAHVMDELPTPTNHYNGQPKEKVMHTVTCNTGTKLAKILGSTSAHVNSAHKEAIAHVPDNTPLVVSAHSDDGVIEGVEIAGHPFAIGVQWHPEFLLTDEDNRLMKAFVDACR